MESGGVEGGIDAKACQTVITCNYRFRWIGGGGVERTIEEKASLVEENFN